MAPMSTNGDYGDAWPVVGTTKISRVGYMPGPNSGCSRSKLERWPTAINEWRMVVESSRGGRKKWTNEAAASRPKQGKKVGGRAKELFLHNEANLAPFQRCDFET